MAPVPAAVNPAPSFSEVTTPGPTNVTGSISTDTVWSPTGSPYVVSGQVKILEGKALTLLPGTVVKFADNLSRLVVQGQLLSLGTPDDRVVFTSLKDDSLLGDTNNDGNASAPAAGDWYAIDIYGAELSATVQRPVSVLDYTDVRFGGAGSGSACGSYGALRFSNGHARMIASNSSFKDSAYGGIHVGTVLTDGFAGIYDSSFSSSMCGVSLIQQTDSVGPTEIVGNTFGSSIDGASIFAVNPNKVRAWFNTMNDVTTVAGGSPTRAQFDLSYNALLGGLGTYGGESDQLQDLKFNWWGDDLNTRALPDGCVTSAFANAYQPPVSTEYSLSCPSGSVRITGWKRSYIAALSSAPNSGLPTSVRRAQAPTFGPVNTFTGELTYSADDLTVQDAGRQITASRTYKSKGAGASDMGDGWRTSFSESLSANSTDLATLDMSDGSAIDFATDAAAGYVPAPGVTAAFETSESGTTITGNDQTSYAFDPQGQLTSVLLGDPDHKVDVARTNGQLSKLTGVSGRYLSYERSAGKLDRIVDSNGRDAHFTYTGGRLASAVGVDDKAETYTYDSDGRLTKVTTPSGVEKLAAGYDSDGRVAWVKEAGSGRADISYDTSADITTITLADDTKIDQNYDSAGRILTEATRGGAGTHVVYDGFGRPISQITGIPQTAMTGYSAIAPATLYDFRGDPIRTIDPIGNTTTTAFNTKHKPVTITNPDGSHTDLTYGAKDRIVNLTDPKQGTWAFTYDAFGQPKTVTDPLNRTTTNTYEADGDLSSTTDVTGATTTYSNDPHGRITSTTNPLGKTTTFDYTSWGQRTKITLPRGGEHTTTFDDDRRIATLTDPTGNTTTYDYDSRGRLQTLTDAANKATTFTYDDLGRSSSMTNARGAIYAQEYTPEGRPKKVTDPDGISTLTTYDPAGRAIRTTNAAGSITQTLYDRAGNAITRQTPDGAQEKYSYDARGRVTTYTAGTGGKWTYTYDPLGAVTKIIDPATSTKLFTYDPVGRLTKATDERANDTTLAYDDAQRTTTVADAVGALRTLKYDAAGHLTSDKNGRNAATTLTYDADGNTATRTTPEGGVTTYDYDLAGRITHTEDPASRVMSSAYDALGHINLRTYADTTTEAYTYDAAGNLVTFRDRNNKAWTSTYTLANRPKSHTDPLDHTTTIDYDDVGLQSKITDPTGIARTYQYDAVGRPTAELNATGAAWSTTYDASGNPLTRADPAGVTTTFTYDTLNRVKTQQTGLLGKITYAYDATSNLLSRTQSTQTLKWEYDPRNRVAATIDGRNNRTTYSYDLADNRTKRTTPEGRIDQWAFDLDDRLTSATDPLGNATSYSYNAARDLTGIQLPRGGAFTFAYNNVGRLTSEKLPGQAARTYEYDGAGNRTSETLPSGATRNYSYDAAGRHTATSATGLERTFGYDPAGRLISASATGQNLTFGYNSRGLLETATSPLGTQTTLYDTAERISRQTLTTGAATDYGYDTNGNLKTVRGPSNYDFTYDQLDRVATVKPVAPTGGTTDSYTYDNDGRLTKVTGTTATLTNTYGPDGLLATSTSDFSNITNPEEGTATYERDLNGRPTKRTLTQGTTTVSTTTYGWDADGNRTTITDAAGTKTWTYDQADRLTSGPDATTYAYDNDGNLTATTPSSGSPTTLSYNALGEVDGLSAPAGTASLARDALGRVAKRVGPGGADTFEYNALTKNPVTYDPASGAAVSLIRDPNGSLLAENPSGGAGRRTLLNGHGDVFALKPQSIGNPAYSAVYDPFGTPTTTGTNTAPLGFQAMVTEPLTGTVDMGFRAYDPTTARFTATDDVYPDMLTGVSINRYAYGGANPLDYVDLDGHKFDLAGAINRYVVQPIASVGSALVGGATDMVASTVRALSNSDAGRSVKATATKFVAKASSKAASAVASLTTTASAAINSAAVQSAVSEARGYAESVASAASRLDTSSIHTALDIAGFVPVVGDAVDGLNAGIYLLEGDTTNALIAFAAMVPVVGSIGVGAYRATDRAVGLAIGLETIAHNADQVSGITRAAGRSPASPWGDAGGGGDLARVGRWMSQAEHEAMVSAGRVQPGRFSPHTDAAYPASPTAFSPTNPLTSRYVEFNVPRSSLVQGGKEGWVHIPGPESIFSRLEVNRGGVPFEYPVASEIRWVASWIG